MHRTLSLLLVVSLFCCGSVSGGDEPFTPKDTVRLFNGKDLKGLSTWLKDTKRHDPRKVFSVKEGVPVESGAPRHCRQDQARAQADADRAGCGPARGPIR